MTSMRLNYIWLRGKCSGALDSQESNIYWYYSQNHSDPKFLIFFIYVFSYIIPPSDVNTWQ